MKWLYIFYISMIGIMMNSILLSSFKVSLLYFILKVNPFYDLFYCEILSVYLIHLRLNPLRLLLNRLIYSILIRYRYQIYLLNFIFILGYVSIWRPCKNKDPRICPFCHHLCFWHIFPNNFLNSNRTFMKMLTLYKNWHMNY